MSDRNSFLFERAQRHIPGGVNSPVRAFRSVGGAPRFFAKGCGARVTDVEGREYLDYVGSWGPLILGHAHPDVVAAVQAAAALGLSFGAPTEREVDLADLLCQLVPSMDMVRLVSSGTEATMSAIRLARGFTGRDLLIKFEGCYHGHSDSLLVKAGSGLLTFGNPNSGGVPADLAKHTLVLDYNDAEQLATAFAEYGDKIAAVIVEPVVGNMNLIAPKPEFLQTMRALCTKYGAVLILDEVMSGFRVGWQSAQGLFHIEPDLTTLGKVIGGGLPVGAYGGKREIMEMVAPAGPMYQAGTLSGNPLAMAAGLTTLEIISSTPDFYTRLGSLSEKLTAGLKEVSVGLGVPIQTCHLGGMFGYFFNENPVTDYRSAQGSDGELFKRFFHGMLKRGIYLAPSQYEAGFMSYAHVESDLERTLEMAKEALAEAIQK